MHVPVFQAEVQRTAHIETPVYALLLAVVHGAAQDAQAELLVAVPRIYAHDAPDPPRSVGKIQGQLRREAQGHPYRPHIIWLRVQPALIRDGKKQRVHLVGERSAQQRAEHDE